MSGEVHSVSVVCHLSVRFSFVKFVARSSTSRRNRTSLEFTASFAYFLPTSNNFGLVETMASSESTGITTGQPNLHKQDLSKLVRSVIISVQLGPHLKRANLTSKRGEASDLATSNICMIKKPFQICTFILFRGLQSLFSINFLFFLPQLLAYK